MCKRALALALVMTSTGCGDDETMMPPVDEPVLREVAGVPAAVAPVKEITVALPAYGASIGATEELVVVGTSAGALAATNDGTTFLGPPEVTIRALAAKDDGLFVFMDGQIAFTKGASVDPLDGLAPLVDADVSHVTTRWVDAGDGPVPEHVMVGRDGAIELAGDTLTAWPIASEAGRPTGALAREDLLLVAYGDRVYEIEREAKTGLRVPLELGSVNDVACDASSCGEGSRLWLATSRGLVERESATSWTLYTLSASAGGATPVRGFALDRTRQRLYAWTDELVLIVRSGDVPHAVAPVVTPDPSLPRVGVVDSVGDLWLASGTSLTKLETGTPLSFATDIQPIMATYCATCHVSGTQGAPVIDFEDYDVAKARVDRIVARMSDVTMPPAGAPQVPADKLKLVLTWATDVAP